MSLDKGTEGSWESDFFLHRPFPLKRFYCILCEFCLHVCLHIMYVLSPQRGQSRVLDPLELDVGWLWAIMWVLSTETPVLCRGGLCSNH